jgi:hypothetical protein
VEIQHLKDKINELKEAPTALKEEIVKQNEKIDRLITERDGLKQSMEHMTDAFSRIETSTAGCSKKQLKAKLSIAEETNERLLRCNDLDFEMYELKKKCDKLEEQLAQQKESNCRFLANNLKARNQLMGLITSRKEMQSLFRNLIAEFRIVQKEVARRVSEMGGGGAVGGWMNGFNDLITGFFRRIFRATRLAENSDGTYPVDFSSVNHGRTIRFCFRLIRQPDDDVYGEGDYEQARETEAAIKASAEYFDLEAEMLGDLADPLPPAAYDFSGIPSPDAPETSSSAPPPQDESTASSPAPPPPDASSAAPPA